nr:uncharacterized protein LOC115259986 isoform X2 [Aedes albopictus]
MSSPSNTANIMNATTSSGNTSVNRVLYNRDNVFTRAKQEKRRNQKNLEERPQIHYQTADIPTGSGLHLDAVDNEFMHTSYLGVQPDKSSMKKQKMEVDDSVNSIDPRLNLSSVVPTDAVFDKVQNETGLSFKTSSIMNATTSSGNTSVNRVLYNRDNVFTRAKQEKRRNQRNLEEKPQIHHQTADIPTGSGLHLDAVDNEFMHTSYLGVQPDKSSMKKQKMEVDDSVNSIDSRLNLSSEIHQTADIPTGSGLHLDAVDNEFMHTSYLGVQPDISSMKKQKMEVDDSVNSIDPRLNISSIVPTDAVFDKVQNETGLSFETGSIMEAENCSQHESFEQANLENSPNCDDWSLISLSNVPSLYTGQMDTSKPADTFKPEVENFDSFVHIRTTKSKCQDPTDLIAFDSDSSLPYDMNHRIKENLRSNEQETPEKMAFSQIYMQQTENHTTIAAGVIMNLNSVPIIGHFQTEIPALPPTPFKHLVTPQIDVTESQVKSNSNSGYTKVKQQRNPNHSDMPPIWDYGLHPQNITATLDNADTQLQPSTTEKRTDAVRGTVLSGATNAALPSGNTYVNHVSYNRDNVFTRAKQEKRRNQNNLEGRGQIHHQTVDIPAGSEMQHDTIHNEFKHTPYLDVQYDIGGRSSMMKPEWNVDNSIKHNDSLTFSSMVPTNTAIDKVPNEIGSSSKNASTINSVALPINVNDNQANFNHDDGYTKVNQPRNRHSNMTKWDNRLQPQNNAITLGNAQTPTAGQRTEGVRSNAQGEATSTKHIKIRDNWTSGAKLEHPRKQTGITNAPRPQQQPPPSRKIRSNDPQSRTRLDPNCGHAEPNRPSSSSVPPRSTNYITETRASNRERRKVGCFQCAIL